GFLSGGESVSVLRGRESRAAVALHVLGDAAADAGPGNGGDRGVPVGNVGSLCLERHPEMQSQIFCSRAKILSRTADPIAFAGFCFTGIEMVGRSRAVHRNRHSRDVVGSASTAYSFGRSDFGS